MKCAEDILQEKTRALVSVAPDTTIFDAIKLMNQHKIGSILIKENDQIIGIWTERDLLVNAADPDFDTKTSRIGDYMSTNLQTAPFNDSTYQLTDKFLGKRIRRLFIEKEGEIIGLLSIGDVVRACLIEKDYELKNLNTLMSWEYYENWRWSPKK